MNKKLIVLLSVLLILTFVFSISAFATSEDITETDTDITAIMESFAGKKVSILGDSISTLKGVSNNTEYNTTIGSNAYYYSSGQASKWWQQVIDVLGMELCVNNSWSGSRVLENNKGTDDNNSAGYVTRCLNLHNDTGETPILPDIIWVFLGTNDFTHNQSAMGSFDAINYDTLITLGEDGTYTYATPTTVFEAYAIMLHKMQQAYPAAEIYCLNLLLRRDPVLAGKTDVGQPTVFNAELAKVVEKAGVHLVDLENCGLESTPEIYDFYITDQYVHPGSYGMDLMSAALLSEMVGTDFHPVVLDAIGASRSNTTFYAIDGSSYTTDITPNTSYENLQVNVTMGGVDVTDAFYSNGTVTIPAVTGHVVLNATAEVQYKDYLQTLPENLCKGVNLWTTLTPTRKCFTNDYKWENASTTSYSITFEVSGGDQLWATSFQESGTNGGTRNGIRLTWFLNDGTFKSISPDATYSEFSANGCMTAPENAVAVNLIQWTPDTTNEVYFLNKEHSYQATTVNGYDLEICSVCESYNNSTFDGAVTLEGFSIKLESTENADGTITTNGLRSISSFDWNKNSKFEVMGYELLEYGAIAVSKDQYESDGKVEIDASTRALTTGGKKVAVWQDGKYVGSKLKTINGVEQYALTVVNYEANHAKDVYFCAYSIYDYNGETVITIVDYPVDGYEYANLYQLTLDMYVNGAINSSNTDDTAVWNTLLTGVVTLTSDEYGTGAIDMDENAFGETFTFKEIASMASGNTVNENIKITLFNDYRTGDYIAIWRGEGRISSCATGYSQFYYNTARTQMSHPKLTKATSQKISTYVFDDGITGINTKYVLRGSYVKTLVCAKTFNYIGAQTFEYTYWLTSMYQAKATGQMQKNEEGLMDLSFITTLYTKEFLYKCDSALGVKKIHFPSKFANEYFDQGSISQGNTTTRYKITKIWCGDTAEPADGVIDFSGVTNMKHVRGSLCAAMSKDCSEYIVILPDNCTRLTNPSSNSHNAFGKINVTQIRQATYTESIVTDIAANSNIAATAKYCDLEGNEWVAPTEENTLRILAIGNSFSEDAMWHLYGILNNAIENDAIDYEYVSLGNLRKSSCTLDTHWSNIENNTGAYNYYTNTNGEWSYVSSYALETALTSQQWDIITIQQESGNSGVPTSYSNLANIVDYVNTNKTNENAKIYWHMTWAYQSDLSRESFATNYNNDQMTMYNAIISTVQSKVTTIDGIAGVIPSGTAIQNARTSYLGDTLTRDGYHLSYGLGRYIAAMTWLSYITGVSLDNINWVPEGYASIALDMSVIKESVNNAITTPYEITSSAYTEEPEHTDAEYFAAYNLDIANYSSLDLTEYTHFQQYYQSVKALPTSMTSGSDLAKQYIGFGTFDKTTLPVGSVIIVDTEDGYIYRPEGWIDAETNNTTRPDEVTEKFVVADEDWWGTFTIRGFNFTKGSEITEEEASHFRIYIPSSNT
ncbi:MAG: DUF4886 domain-containing protein [Clostridia bacterium]|nr:DUF4886 domain-containing protein [Clostridia bacterium]